MLQNGIINMTELELNQSGTNELFNFIENYYFLLTRPKSNKASHKTKNIDKFRRMLLANMQKTQIV